MLSTADGRAVLAVFRGTITVRAEALLGFSIASLNCRNQHCNSTDGQIDSYCSFVGLSTGCSPPFLRLR
jgi:hypothetical protein